MMPMAVGSPRLGGRGMPAMRGAIPSFPMGGGRGRGRGFGGPKGVGKRKSLEGTVTKDALAKKKLGGGDAGEQWYQDVTI
jgi:hypothetical protein